MLAFSRDPCNPRRAQQAALLLVLALAVLVAAPVRADAPAADPELQRHVAAMRERMLDPARPLAERQRLALETAATLDRAASGATDLAARRARWAEAAAILDAFNAAAPAHDRRPEFALQAAVYTWAQARTWLDQLEFQPGAADLRERARTGLDAAEQAFRHLTDSPVPTIAAQARYRLARALVDRARTVEADAERLAALDEAVRLAERAAGANELDGYARALGAEAHLRAGRPTEALAALDAVAQAKTVPSDAELLPIRAEALAASGRMAEAIALIERSGLRPPARDLLEIDVLLAGREPAGGVAERRAAEAEAIERTGRLSGGAAAQARVKVARAIPNPSPDLPPAALDLLAEGHAALGDPDAAVRVLLRAAEREPDPALAAERLLRAASLQVRQGRDADAIGLLGRIVDDPRAGAVRGRADLLRAVVIGRGTSFDRARAALEGVIRRFPDDPVAGEARWELGRWFRSEADPDGAQAAWLAIPSDHSRRPEAVLAVADLRHELAARLDPARTTDSATTYASINSFLNRNVPSGSDQADRVEFDLARLRLELSEPVPNPRLERIGAEWDELKSRPMDPTLRERWAALEVLLELRRGRFAQAEALASRVALGEAGPAGRELAVALDRYAQSTRNDLERRRCGTIIGVLTARPFADASAPSGSDGIETTLLGVRAEVYRGDPAGARRRLAADLSRLDGRPTRRDRLDQGRTALLAGDYAPAQQTYGSVLEGVEPGHPAWFEARLGLVEVYLETGRARVARQLIDATRVLEPGLGGDWLRPRFEQFLGRLEGH